MLGLGIGLRSRRVLATSVAIAAIYLPTTATAPIGVFGLSKMVADYSGPAITVRRSTDNATQDIAFSGQALNAAAASTFAGGGTLYVTKVYNQDGSGRDIVQATEASQPVLQMVGPSPSIMFNGTFMSIPTTITADRQNCTMLAVAMDLHQAVDEALFAMGAAGAIDLGYSGQPVSSQSAQPYADGSKIAVAGADGSTVSTASKGVFGLVSSPSSIIVHRDGKSATAAATTSKSMTVGGFIGKGSTNGKSNFYAFVIYPAALSSGDVLAVKTALKTIHKTNDWSGAYNISIYGDSKTYAVALPANNITPTRLLADLYNSPAYIVRNRAISGSYLDGGTTNYASNKGIESDGTNVLVLAKGTNDVSNVRNRTAAQLWGDFQATIASARAAGYTRFVGVTLTPRKVDGTFTSAMEAERVAFNTRLIANDGGLVDAVANYNTIPELGTDGAPNYPTMFPDWLHESDAAYALEAPVLKAAIDAAIAAALKPSCTTTPVLSGGTTVGSVQTCSTGVWGNAAGISYAYQWFYADALADISGANASTLTLASPDVGHTLGCRVTATTANGSSTTRTLASAVVTSTSLGISGAPGAATVGTAYTFTPVTVGGTTPYGYAISAGALPAGLSVNPSTGSITGTPTTAQTPSFTLTVTDALGATANLVTSITVTASASAMLDTVSASPVGAYSVQKIKGAYTGPALRAYRDGDNAVGDVAFDSVSATPSVSAASVITITSAGTSGYTVGQTMTFSTFWAGATVRAGIWYDQDGTSNDLSQATQSAMAIIVNAGTLVTKGGVATLDFSGSTSYAFPTSTLAGNPAGNKRTVSAVVSRESTSASTLLSPSGAGGIEFIIEAAQMKVQKAFGGVSAVSTTALTLNLLSSILMAWDGTNFEFLIAGASAGSGTTAAQTFTGSTTMRMGAGTNFVRNKVSELVIFDTALLSSGDKAALHTSQATRFGVA